MVRERERERKHHHTGRHKNGGPLWFSVSVSPPPSQELAGSPGAAARRATYRMLWAATDAKNEIKKK